MSVAAVAHPPDDGLPLVAGAPKRDTGLYVFLAILLAGGTALFAVLASGRDQLQAPITAAPADPSQRISAPPPLNLPDAYRRAALRDLPPAAQPLAVRGDRAPASEPRVSQPLPPSAPQRSVVPPSAPDLREPMPSFAPPPYRPGYDNGDVRAASPSSVEPLEDDRVLATRFANPSFTVPKGTIIPAVLETAIDSTRPGGVRALVQRDIHAFDGSRVLVPRGSRLYGEYEASLQPGQKRALVTWTRLMRPDGVMIALASPASDPLGRAGIRGKVDSKFLARFGNAILQSALDLGVGVAAAEVTGGVVVAVPGAVRSANPQVSDNRQIQPTLRVNQGTSVSVFVAKDLDFSSVGG